MSLSTNTQDYICDLCPTPTFYADLSAFINHAQIHYAGPNPATRYLIPPKSNPRNAQDYTSFVPSLALYCERNLPVEMGVLAVPKTGRRLLKDQNGNQVRGPGPKFADLYDFPNIPLRICSGAEYWRLTMFMDMNPDAQYSDLTNRMVVHKEENAISARVQRYRSGNGSKEGDWKNFPSLPTKDRCRTSHPKLRALNNLNQAQKALGVFWTMGQHFNQIFMPRPKNLRPHEIWTPVLRTIPVSWLPQQQPERLATSERDLARATQAAAQRGQTIEDLNRGDLHNLGFGGKRGAASQPVAAPPAMPLHASANNQMATTTTTLYAAPPPPPALSGVNPSAVTMQGSSNLLLASQNPQSYGQSAISISQSTYPMQQSSGPSLSSSRVLKGGANTAGPASRQSLGRDLTIFHPPMTSSSSYQGQRALYQPVSQAAPDHPRSRIRHGSDYGNFPGPNNMSGSQSTTETRKRFHPSDNHAGGSSSYGDEDDFRNWVAQQSFPRPQGSLATYDHTPRTQVVGSANAENSKRRRLTDRMAAGADVPNLHLNAGNRSRNSPQLRLHNPAQIQPPLQGGQHPNQNTPPQYDNGERSGNHSSHSQRYQSFMTPLVDLNPSGNALSDGWIAERVGDRARDPRIGGNLSAVNQRSPVMSRRYKEMIAEAEQFILAEKAEESSRLSTSNQASSRDEIGNLDNFEDFENNIGYEETAEGLDGGAVDGNEQSSDNSNDDLLGSGDFTVCRIDKGGCGRSFAGLEILSHWEDPNFASCRAAFLGDINPPPTSLEASNTIENHDTPLPFSPGVEDEEAPNGLEASTSTGDEHESAATSFGSNRENDVGGSGDLGANNLTDMPDRLGAEHLSEVTSGNNYFGTGGLIAQSYRTESGEAFGDEADIINPWYHRDSLDCGPAFLLTEEESHEHGL